MKKIHLFSLATLAAGMAFTSCTNDEEVLDQASVPSGLKVSIPATFAGNADTRVLKLEGNTLKSEWTEGDKVYVHNNNSAFDSNPLVADASGSKVNLEGELAGEYNIDDILTLAYTYKKIPYVGVVIGGFEYSSQKGTFEDVQNYDFSVATVKVTAVDGGKVTTTDATFEPYQSIFKFTFKNESDEAINVKYLTIKSNNGKVIFGGRPAPTDNDGAGPIKVTLDTPNTEVWVAMRVNESIDDQITFEVEDADGKLYSGSKESSDKPLNGKYYTSTVTVEQVGETTLKIEPEESRTLDGKVYTVTTDGATASGYGKDFYIRINDGVTLTLDGVTLEGGSVGTSASNNTIVLDGENEVADIDVHPNYGGITFEGTGKLVIKSSNDYSKDYSNIYLKDGLVLTYNAATQTNTIEPKDADEAIVFEDNAVKTASVAAFDKNSNGEISYSEAAAVTDLGAAFTGNTSIKYFTELRFFTGLTAITESAFEGCTALETITLPNVITSIAAKAFKGATSLKLIVIPPLVTTIGASAFEGCTALKGNRDWEFVFPASVTSIGASAFKNCTSLASFDPHSTTLEIGASAFENAALSSNHVNMTYIEDGELKIGDRAFAGSKLSRINFGAATSPQFGNEVFLGCENLYLMKLSYVATPPAFGTDMLKDCNNLGVGSDPNKGIIVPAASVDAYKAADGWKEYKDIIFGQ